jgi:protein-S-isoprenylcysteine O-methyltransferase Ste14
VTICGLGARWAQLTYVRREKGSLLWQRNAFLVGALMPFGLVAVAMDRRNAPHLWIVAVCLLSMAVVTGVFAYAAFREYRRTTGTSSRSRSSHSSSSAARADADGGDEDDDDETDE